MALIAEGLAAKGIRTVVYTSAVPIERHSISDKPMHIEHCAPAQGSGTEWTRDLLHRLQTVNTTYSAALVLLSSVCPRTTVEAAQFLHRRGTRVVVRVSSAGRLAALDGRDRAALGQIAAFVVQSEPLRRELISDGVPSDRVLMIPNSPCVSASTTCTDTRRTSGRTVLFAGRLDPKKDVSLLVAAWKKVERRFGEARLRIVGSDSWEVWKGRTKSTTDLLETVRTLRLSRVQFVGEKSQGEMLAEYLAATIAVSASRNEGMSNFLIEAMACGLPLICSDIPANRFIDFPNSGNWKFEVGNQHSLGLALESALATPHSVLQSIGRMNYEWSTRNLALDPILALYRSALRI